MGELSHVQWAEKQYGQLAVDVKDEERALIVRTRAASQHLNVHYGKSLNKFALAEKEGIRGYSSGQGTTCTRQEAREREKRTKALRMERFLQTR